MTAWFRNSSRCRLRHYAGFIAHAFNGPADRCFLVDLNKEIGPEWINDFVKGWGDGARLGEQGHRRTAPSDLALGTLLNADAFKKAGVAIPDQGTGWTWDEFVPKIKEVAEKSGTRYPLVWDVSASRWIVHEIKYGNRNEGLEMSMPAEKWAWTSRLRVRRGFRAHIEQYDPDFVKVLVGSTPRATWT